MKGKVVEETENKTKIKIPDVFTPEEIMFLSLGLICLWKWTDNKTGERIISLEQRCALQDKLYDIFLP